MTTNAILLSLAAAAYLIGSIPFGLIVGLANGIDPRTAGSKNIGATNVGRLLGGKFFALVFTLDLLKSFLPTLAASIYILRQNDHSTLTHALWLFVGFAAVIGHVFPIYLKFKGGKGVATSAGVMLGVYPYFTLAAFVAIAVFIVVFMITRYVSLGSMIGAASFPIAYATIGISRGWPITGDQSPLLIFSAIVALLIVVKHRTNISRLLAGTEHKIGSPKPPAAA